MSAAIAYEIRNAIPVADDVLVEYLAGLIDEASTTEDDVLQVTRDILESPAEDDPAALDNLIKRLAIIVTAKQQASAANGPRITKLDKILDMSKTGSLSSTIQFSDGVDLESINKSKCVNTSIIRLALIKRVQSNSCRCQEARKGRGKTSCEHTRCVQLTLILNACYRPRFKSVPRRTCTRAPSC